MGLLEKLLPQEGELIINRYELREELGRGGFGVVYRATQVGLDEDVAIKILLPHVLENDDIAMRFEREVAVAKGLRHPNSIRILDYSQTDKGLPFYVMEYIRGRELSEVIKEAGSLSPARTRRIVGQALASLAEAHSRGVVHRDLKPANIMVCDIFGEKDFVKVLDFGIAKALTDDASVQHTNTGMVLGTPAYMSPEQALGRKELDGRSDLYAMGLIIAECLAGRPVVTGETPYLMVAAHASAAPLPFHPDLMHNALWGVIMTACAKNRDHRYPDAVQMRQALEGLGQVSDQAGPVLSAAGHMQPPTSVPHVTPHPSAAYSGGLVIGGPTADKTVAGMSSIMDMAEPGVGGNTGKAIAIFVLLLLLVGVGIAGFKIVSSSGPDSDANSDIIVEQQLDEPDQVADNVGTESGQTANSGVQPNGVQSPENDQIAAVDPTPQAPGVDPNLVQAMSRATAFVSSGIPQTGVVSFSGLEGVTVSQDGHVWGVTPFDARLPRVDHSVDVDYSRSGYRSDSDEVSFLASAVDVNLRRRHRNTDRNNSNDETTTETAEEPADNSPFGRAQIH